MSAAVVTAKTRARIDAQEQAKVREARRAWSPKSLMLPFQRALADDPSRYIVGVWSRQTGKSFTTGEIAAEGAITDPGGAWTCLSAGERQALEWLEKTKEWAQAFRLSIDAVSEDRGGNIAEALLKSAEIRFATGGIVRAIPANPATARGYSTNVILDEFGYHEDPDKIWRAMFPSSANPLAGTFMERVAAHLKGGDADAVRRRDLRVIVVSTFNGRGNKFFDLWEKRKANGWSGHLTTIEDAVRQGLPVDIEKLRQALDDPDGWAQEFMCEPMDSSNVLLPYDLIATAESADATEACDIAALPARGNPIYCGIDFGRQSDPTVCWTCELAGGVLWTREVLVLKGVDTPDQQAILASRIQAATRVSFDYTGPGVGLGDLMARQHGEWKPEAHKLGKVELVTFTLKSKREMFPRLRRRFEAPVTVRVPVSRDVREDLHAMQQRLNNGSYDYWAPRTREGHSDRCTALALCVRAADWDAGGGSWGWLIGDGEDAA